MIDVAEHGVLPDGQDCTRALKIALAECRGSGAKRLVFPKGRYVFRPEFADELYLFTSNNDEGLKRVAFMLNGLEDLVIDGQGSEFIFHGFISPFVVQNCANIVFENFSVDFERTFHSEGIIVAAHEEGLDVRIPEAFPYKVHNGLLLFMMSEDTGGPLTSVSKGEVCGSGHLLEFDTAKRETAFMARDYFFNGTSCYAAKDLGGRVVRLSVPGLVGKLGNTLVFGPDHRKHPGFVVTHSREVSFERITLHHAGGMGILGQLSHNLRVHRCRVTPSHGRMLSTTADATHFVNCTGFIELTENLFENQKDDATNIHGTYVQVTEILDANEIMVRLMHRQQHGFDFLHAGVEVEFVHGKSMITLGASAVKKAVRINKEFTRVVFDRALPKELVVGDALASIHDYARVTISGNIVRNNRARGMLLNCRGKTVVENNYFHTPGAAILFEGDSFFWFEQGGVRDCVIRKNVFENCLFGVWGKAVIDVKAGILERKESSRYNRNILIENNTFRVFGEQSLLHAYCMDGLTWRDNRVELTTAYPAPTKASPRFDISHCDNVVIDGEPRV
ncbi:MAG: right-handed parallel beta-helix repeat-containing protein [Opitutaceae bacterium]|nr:right-handed parallel beta-helix repeat-containing protein [Opitutaceae bacterium]